MAHSCGIELTLDDFQRVSDRVPFIADLKPSGKYVMEDVHLVRGGEGGAWAAGCVRGFESELELAARGRAGRGSAWFQAGGGDAAEQPRRARLERKGAHLPAEPAFRPCHPAQVGGTPAVLKYLHAHNLIDGNCLTVTGKTLAENLDTCPGLKEGQQVGGGGGPRGEPWGPEPACACSGPL